MGEEFRNFLNTTCTKKKSKEKSEEVVEATTEYSYDYNTESYDYDAADAGEGDNTDVFKKVCVGSLIPAVGEKYPRTDIEMIMFPHGIPSFEFAEGKGVMFASGNFYIGISRMN